MMNRQHTGTTKPAHVMTYIVVVLGLFRVVAFILKGAISLAMAGFRFGQRRKQKQLHRENIDRIVENRAYGRHGNDRPFNFDDANENGMIMPEGDEGGLYLGAWDHDGTRYYLRWPSDESLFICGAAGSFKSWSMTSVNAISTALRGESQIVLDLKGELYAACHEGLSQIHGVETLRISPFEKHSDFRVNLLGDLVRAAEKDELSKDDCLAATFAFIPKEKLEGNNGFVGEEAVRMIAPYMGWLAYEPILRSKCHVGEIADITSVPITAFLKLMEHAAQSDALDGWVKEEAENSLSKYAPNKKGKFDPQILKEYNWYMSLAKHAFSPYSKGGKLRQFTSVDSTARDSEVWEPGTHKSVPHAAFMDIPPRYTKSHGEFVAALIDYAIRSIRDAKGNVRTNFILDEIGNIGQVLSVPEGLQLLRGYGCRFICAVQDRLSLKKYEKVGGSQLFESQSIQLVWTVGPQHAREIENRAGYHTEVAPSYRTSTNLQGDSGDWGGSEFKKPNLSVAEIGMVGKGEAIFMAPGLPVGIFKRPIYSDIPFVAPYIKDIREDPNYGDFAHG